MIDNGDEALRIWASEYGLPTAGPNAVTEEQQSAFIQDFLNAWSELDYTGPSFIYTTRDRIDGTTEDGSFGLFYYDWTAKLAAQVIKDFIEAHQTPTDPGDPDNPPDLGSQLAQALQAFFNQIQAAFHGFVNSWNSFVDSIAQAIANIFNPGGAAALSVPAAMQDEVAEGTTMAAMAVKEDTTAASDTSGSDAAKSESAEVTATTEAAAEDVSTDTTTATSAETEESTTATVDAKASDAEQASNDQKTADTEKSTTEATKTSTDGTTKTDTTVKTDAGETKTPTSAQSDTGSSVGAATSTESREPTRTAVVVVGPTKAATGDTEAPGTTTSNGDTTGGTADSTATSGSRGSDSRGAS